MTSSHRDYVPQNAVQFKEFMERLIAYYNTKKGVWTTIPSERFLELAAAFTVFDKALSTALSTPTDANINRRNEARTETVRLLRAFVNQFLRFPPVDNNDRIEMGIPNHDTVRTDHKVVTEMVDFVLHLRNIREILVDFWIQGQTHKAKPHGYDGAVIVWDVLDAPPANPDALNHHTMASRTPFAIHFDETQRGKTVYIAAAWQNERGILGQWSEIKTAIVP